MLLIVDDDENEMRREGGAGEGGGDGRNKFYALAHLNSEDDRRWTIGLGQPGRGKGMIGLGGEGEIR